MDIKLILRTGDVRGLKTYMLHLMTRIRGAYCLPFHDTSSLRCESSLRFLSGLVNSICSMFNVQI